jgi:hypothetical protein
VKRIARYLLVAVAWLFVTGATSIAAALACEPLREFGRSLYLIDGALLLGALGLWKLWRNAPRTAMIATAVVVLGGAALATAMSLSPAGKYALGGCRGGLDESTKDEYLELSGGVFYDVMAGHRHRLGSYYKKDGHWILKMDRRDGVLDEQLLRFSVLGFDTVIPPVEGNEGGPTEFNRRRLIPFTRPHWIPERLE